MTRALFRSSGLETSGRCGWGGGKGEVEIFIKPPSTTLKLTNSPRWAVETKRRKTASQWGPERNENYIKIKDPKTCRWIGLGSVYVFLKR